jgi:lysophospholipase L1-like esterase
MIISGETRKNILSGLVSAFLSLVLFLFVIEVFLDFKYEKWKSTYTKNGDWYGGITTISKNPILMWEYRPNATSNIQNIPEIRTNQYGFRDYDYGSLAKPPDVFRISFIGDSVTLGIGVESQNTFVNKFTEYARQKYPNQKIQSMNHGIDGYNTIQIFELLTSRVLQFRPDTIVYVMCINDFDFEESSGGKSLYFNKPDSFVLKNFLELYRRLLRIDFHIWHFRKNKQVIFDKIVEMKELLRAQNIDFQIALIPVFGFNNSDKTFSAYPLYEIHFAIRQFLMTEQIDFIDLLDSFTGHEKPPDYFAYDIWHPNEKGHDFIAQKLLQFLTKNL